MYISVVDEWFALSYVDGKYNGVLTLPEVIGRTHLTTDKLPNHKMVSPEAVAFGESLLSDVVNNTNKIMEGKYQEYQDLTFDKMFMYYTTKKVPINKTSFKKTETVGYLLATAY